MGGVAKNICKGNDEQIPLVSICSITFNHAPYIRLCLDGFFDAKDHI